jgi:ribosomal protein S17
LVTETRNSKKKKIGRVVSNKMVKTVVVMVEYYIPHRLYNKRVRHLSKFKAHDEQNRRCSFNRRNKASFEREALESSRDII